MTDLLLDLESYLTSNDITSLVYRDYIPDDVDNAIVLIEYAGQSSLPQIGTSNRSVQVVTFDKVAATAKLLARRVYKLFETEDGIVSIVPERISVVNLRQPPFRLKTDEMQRVHYAFNMGIITYND